MVSRAVVGWSWPGQGRSRALASWEPLLGGETAERKINKEEHSCCRRGRGGRRLGGARSVVYIYDIYNNMRNLLLLLCPVHLLCVELQNCALGLHR